jgi:ubiquinone/menaquinone biosynthesis C-methylase UbiE
MPAAEIVGPHGRVYALDIHPLAVKAVQKRADRAQLANIETIQSGCDTQLADASVDIVLLYDVLHAVPNKRALLDELHRILKPGGRISVLPDHMTEQDLSATMEAGGLFTMQTRHGEVFEFKKPMET